MSFGLRAAHVVYWLSLTLWISVLVAAAVAATGVFAVLPDLGMTLDRFEAYDTAEHGRLAAGMVMEPIFAFVDLSQFVLAAMVLATLAAQLIVWRLPWRRPANLIRTACILGAVTLLIFRGVAVTPEMNQELRAYWRAAEAGDLEAAREHRDAFEKDHPAATWMFQTTLVLLLVASGASAVAPGPPARRRPQADLETPRLLEQR